jgi:regulation of enolase protein 1 (concanavalin A-like superfamily)
MNSTGFRTAIVGLGVAAVLLVWPLAQRELFRRVEEPEADRPDAAIAWRALSLKDDRGLIDPDGLMRAHRHVKTMKEARSHRRMVGPSALPETSATTEASATDASRSIIASSVDLSRDGWTWMGPGNIGGRVRALLVHPTNPSVMFAGSVGGGIWRTTDGGARWAPVDDFMANLAVTTMVFKPGNPQVMYAGTGEGYFNIDAIRGAGIFKSVDGGSTWTQLPSTAGDSFFYVNRLAISPDGRTLLAGTRRGTFRSTDGGASWVRPATGGAATDVDFHPTDSSRAIAGDFYGSAWYSRNSGATWMSATGLTVIGRGSGRVEVAYSRSNPDITYALVDIDGGVVYRSVDGGASYTLAYSGPWNPPPLFLTSQGDSQGWYDNALWVNPRNANNIIVAGINVFTSDDGGVTFAAASGPIHVDHHVIVEHPQFDNVSNRIVFFGNDGGVYKAPDVSRLTDQNPTAYVELNNNLGVTQFYSAAGNATTGVIVGGTQDNGTLRFGPASGTEGWSTTFGGDGGFSAADQTDPNYFYGEYVYLQIFRSANGGNSARFIVDGLGDARSNNANFIAPFLLDPNEPRRMLAGGVRLWRTNNVKSTSPAWRVIKPGTDSSSNISAIAVSSQNSNVVWVGHNNGDLYRTMNGTAEKPAWTRLDGVSFPNRYITRITIDPNDPNVVYTCFGGFVDGNIQKTVDGGATWLDATGKGTTGLPAAPVRDVAVDPTDSNTLWAATEVGVFSSHDGGSTWDLPQDGPANVSVEQLFLMGDSLVAVTHGRGLFRHLLGTGLGIPGMTFAPDRIEFPTAYVGVTIDPIRLDVVNSGTANLEIDSVSIQGANPGDFNVTADSCAGTTVVPLARCSIRLTFRPTALGTRSATVVLTDNADGSPHSAPVNGIGLAPPIVGDLPLPWTTRDIGAVGAEGGAGFVDGVFTVAGAGADVWDASDAFRFVYQPLTGDVDVRAQVTSVQHVSEWAKAGVMIRETLQPGSRHAFMLVSAAKGVAFQRRPSTGGITTSTSVPATVPLWVRLTRIGAVVNAWWSDDGSGWHLIGQDLISMAPTVYVGLAVSSHVDARRATATFDHVRASTLPITWNSRDIGTITEPGSVTRNSGVWTVRGGGADVWDETDAFRYVYRRLSTNGEIVARVLDIENVEDWTKAGVMIRQSLAPDSAHAFMFVSAVRGLAFQRRTTTGGLTTTTAAGRSKAPRWVKLSRAGQTITASVSKDGIRWTHIGHDTLPISGTVYVGLAVCSHDVTKLATAVFDNVRVE